MLCRRPLVVERAIRSSFLSCSRDTVCIRRYAAKATEDKTKQTKRSLSKTLKNLQKEQQRLKAAKQLVESVAKNDIEGGKAAHDLFLKTVSLPAPENKEKPKSKKKKANAKVKASRRARRQTLRDSGAANSLDVSNGGLEEGWKDAEWKDHLGLGVDALTPQDWNIDDFPPIANVLLRSENGVLRHLAERSILQDIPSQASSHEIASLGDGLERVLFNPGSVHWLQDPRSGVYNFDKRYQTIPDVTKFDFGRLPGFTRSSMDNELHELARKYKKSFAGSTSSLSGLLAQLYFLISEERDVETSVLSKEFQRLAKGFTPAQRMPVSVVLRYRDGVHAIDAEGGDGDYHKFNILMWQGTMLEKLLTYPEKKFANLLPGEGRGNGNGTDPEEKNEAFRYSTSNSFVMRSQLDARDPRLPGTGVFDIKTRAALPLRLDVLNYKEHAGYHILYNHGLYSSFEREYYDMIRSAFLKYSFQVRIGNMDGIFVSYHNTARIFGFQYIPLEEMDMRLFGPKGVGLNAKDVTEARTKGDRVFNKCVQLLEVLCEEVAKCYPEMSVACTVYTTLKGRSLNAWVQPLGHLPAGSSTPSIMELTLEAKSYLNEERASSSRAIDEVDKPWEIRYQISRSPDSERAIRRRFEYAKRRQQFDYYLPAGISFENLQSYWEQLGWDDNMRHDAGEGRLTMSNVKEERFKHAGGLIEVLRGISRKGLEREAVRHAKSNVIPKEDSTK